MVSVVIRSRNEERYIGYCLQSITDFVGKPEIILVDNESTDNTIRIVNRFEYHDITKLHISKDDYTPGRALNLGIKQCTEDYVMILSAHCEVVKFNFDSLKEQLDRPNPSHSAIWGKQIPIWDGKKVTPRYLWSNFGDERKVNYWSDSENRYFFHNAFSVFNTEHLKTYLFDERLSGKEDRYWANDQIEKGYDIVYNPNLVVKHYYTINSATWKGVG